MAGGLTERRGGGAGKSVARVQDVRALDALGRQSTVSWHAALPEELCKPAEARFAAQSSAGEAQSAVRAPEPRDERLRAAQPRQARKELALVVLRSAEPKLLAEAPQTELEAALERRQASPALVPVVAPAVER